ncbi:MAG: putative 2-aminoethylphosphonate ABC transporter ATP-binding protein [Gammaproteobacteria bacterium]|nr:putative 2-aminoethylphosphonate ABC transporter ATP-binding protein [Gammaproteobacteria bacterium]
MSGQRTNSYLKIRGLTKKFGRFTALSDVELDVDEGEFVCFLGPSGCGKTTLLRAIAGLDIQTYGQIEQAGKDISDLPPSERDFGIVFQSYALFPNLTIAKNIAYGLENEGHRKSDILKRVTELLDLVGMPDQSDKYPSQLSGGQQQRVALARAIAISPGLLLLDEPLSALDAKVRVKLRGEIKDLQEKLGVTTIMVTHDQEEALTMADRIVVINEGVIEQVGTPEEIYHTPATQFVADFIGTMNFLPANAIGKAAMNDLKVRIGDIELDCDYDEQLLGKQVLASIRPEDVVVGNNHDPADRNVIEVKIDNIEFLGAFGRATLSSTQLGAVRFMADFSANLMRAEKISRGMTISVSLPSQSIRVYAI